MRRLTLRLIVALLTFIIGVTAASFWYVFWRASSVPTEIKNNVPSQTLVKLERKYERGIAGEGVAGATPTGSFITFNSSDGMRFTKWSMNCDTPQGAKRELQKRLKKAVEIVSRESMFDASGQQIGEKVVALFATKNADNSPASLIWTEKEELFQIETSSLQNILEYKKDFKR